MTLLPFRRLLLLSLFLILFFSPQTTLAQNAKNDWGQVQKIKIGSKIVVKTKTGQRFEGKVIAKTADYISVSISKASGQATELRKDEVAEIRKRSGARIAGLAALLGGIGLVGGYAIGYGIGEAVGARGPIELPGAGVGAISGAVTGAIIGSRGQLIYKAP